MAGKFFEPQTPIMQNGDFYYPLTTAKQVILPDGRRLGGEDGLNLNADDVDALSIDLTDVEYGTANGINADTLGGVAADAYALKDDLDVYKNETSSNVDTILSENKTSMNELSNRVAETINELSNFENSISVNFLLKNEVAANSNKSFGYTFDELKTYMLDAIYPIGSIYMSFSQTSPSNLFGGTWEQLKDRFLIGAGGSYSAGATGGAATHTLTVNEMPSHTHAIQGFWNVGSGSRQSISRYTVSGDPYEYGNIQYTGGNAAHNNMPPYLAVYMWKRTA